MADGFMIDEDDGFGPDLPPKPPPRDEPPPWDPPSEPPEPPTDLPQPPPPDEPPPEDDDRPVIEITTEQMEVNDQAIAAVAGCDHQVFQRGGELVDVIDSSTEDAMFCGAPFIRALPKGRLREIAADAARWRKYKGTTKEGKAIWASANPPPWCLDAMLERGAWEDIPWLEGIVEAPILRRDGTILDEPGHDSESGLFFRPNDEFDVVPESPSRQDAQHAFIDLLELVQDFPFEEEIHRSVWVAGLLTPFARYAFSGPTPMFVFDANAAGCGKTLLAELISELVMGRAMPRGPQAKDAEEEKKRITSLVLTGGQLFLLDNVAIPLGNDALDAALTTTYWQDRILGQSKMGQGPLRIVWYATGNNVRFRGDTIRRCLHSRLVTDLERPEERGEFKQPQLVAHVRKNRGSYVRAALTILRAHAIAGRPGELKAMGSYEGWSKVVRGAITWLGAPDPALSQINIREVADTTRNAHASLLEQLEVMTKVEAYSVAVRGRRGSTASHIVKALDSGQESWDALREAVGTLCRRPTASAIGAKLRALRETTVGGRKVSLVRAGGRNVWVVLKADEPLSPQSELPGTDVHDS